jgi:hypothetical protein
MLAPTAPGLGVDIVEEAIARYPSEGNISPPNPNEEYVYFRARQKRASWLGAGMQERPGDFV